MCMYVRTCVHVCFCMCMCIYSSDIHQQACCKRWCKGYLTWAMAPNRDRGGWSAPLAISVQNLASQPLH